MATFKFSRAIDLHWNGYEIQGPAETVFSIPDQLYEEFNDDIAPVEPSLVWIDTNEFLTLQNSVQVGGVTSVSGTSPITTSGTTAITVGVISASTTSAGVVILSDSTSTTSSVLAATPTAVKSAYDLAASALPTDTFGLYAVGSSTIIATHLRFVLQNSASNPTGQVHHTKLIPHKNFTVSNIAFFCVTASTPSPLTLGRFGIYTRSGTTFTLVARTASDTTIFNAGNTKFTRALDTTGGYPATYDLIAGQEYWISAITVGNSAGTLMVGLARQSTVANLSVGGVQMYTQSSQTDLPASSTGAASLTNGGFYAEVS